MKVYLSSTYVDLRRHRKAMALALRKAQYNVVMMEEYVARDLPVEFACQGDVAACDAYIGVFAWRYGHVPEDNNPDGRSVTELEYLTAKGRIPSRVFLLRDDATWPGKLKDVDPTRINALRTNLKKICAGYFSNASELTVEVLTALRVLESTRRVQQLEAVAEMHRGQELGPSYLMNIQGKLGTLWEPGLIRIQIGPIPWWNTRLYLIAALADDFGDHNKLVFVDADQRFLTMASPAEIRRRLAQRWPALKSAYREFRKDGPSRSFVENELWRFPMAVSGVFGKEEVDAKEDVTSTDLQRALGIVGDAETVDSADKGQVFLQHEILGRATPFVALVRDGRLEGVVDKAELANKVALKALAQEMDLNRR
jgi:hypothetical protein